jgi:hypothetical protein
MNSAMTITLDGASGTTYEFAARPLSETPGPFGGIYVIGRRQKTSGSGESLQVLFIGQSDDFTQTAEGFREEDDLRGDPDVLFCLHLEESDGEARDDICEDLRSNYMPQEEL